MPDADRTRVAQVTYTGAAHERCFKAGRSCWPRLAAQAMAGAVAFGPLRSHARSRWRGVGAQGSSWLYLLPSSGTRLPEIGMVIRSTNAYRVDAKILDTGTAIATSPPGAEEPLQ